MNEVCTQLHVNKVAIALLTWCYGFRQGFSHHWLAALTVRFHGIIMMQGRGSRAVFQFYPENPAQMELITQQAMKAGFTGGVVVDFPNSTKAKKYSQAAIMVHNGILTSHLVMSRMFLCLFTGGAPSEMPQVSTKHGCRKMI